MVEKLSQPMSINEMGELKLVGFRVLCAGDKYATEISKATQRLVARMSEIKNKQTPLQPVGAFVVENDNDNEDGYWICFEVKEYEDIPNDMVALTIPAQRYAVIRHIGANDEIRDSYNKLHSWIEKNKYNRLLNCWHIEKYICWSDEEKVEIELMDTIE